MTQSSKKRPYSGTGATVRRRPRAPSKARLLQDEKDMDAVESRRLVRHYLDRVIDRDAWYGPEEHLLARAIVRFVQRERAAAREHTG